MTASLRPELEVLVRDARTGHLATVDEEGRPHVVPVCFVYEGGAVYSVLDAKPKRVEARKLQRVRNLLDHPRVQLLVDRYDEDWTSLVYVQLRGVASLLFEGDERRTAVASLRSKYEQYVTMAIDEAPVVKITVDRVVAWSASPPSAGDAGAGKI